jgi:hypothetical protein
LKQLQHSLLLETPSALPHAAAATHCVCPLASELADALASRECYCAAVSVAPATAVASSVDAVGPSFVQLLLLLSIHLLLLLRELFLLL